MKYQFKNIERCEMCGDPTSNHKILGQRANQSQGFKPRKIIGISVTIQQCNNCKLIYSNPQPIPFDIHDHYGTPPEDYWKAEYFEFSPNYFSTQITHIKKLLSCKEIKALDIGAGIGKAMKAMEEQGIEAYGLEPSSPFYERAISKTKINPSRLKLGSVEQLDYDEGQFDFITFGAVFEHLYNPAFCLEKALKWLRDDGVIHIEVPSSKWLFSTIINTYNKMLGTTYVTNLSPMHSPFHLYEFHIDSFKELSKTANFEIAEYYYDVCAIYYFPKFLHPFVKFYMEKTKTGMQMSVYLRKTKKLN